MNVRTGDIVRVGSKVIPIGGGLLLYELPEDIKDERKPKASMREGSIGLTVTWSSMAIP